MLAGLRGADRDGGARFAPEHSSNIDARLRYDSSPVVDVFVIAKVAATCGLRTVRVGKPRGTRNGGPSALEPALPLKLSAPCPRPPPPARPYPQFRRQPPFSRQFSPSTPCTRPSAPTKFS